jgi:hypothetical protein
VTIDDCSWGHTNALFLLSRLENTIVSQPGLGESTISLQKCLVSARNDFYYDRRNSLWSGCHLLTRLGKHRDHFDIEQEGGLASSQHDGLSKKQLTATGQTRAWLLNAVSTMNSVSSLNGQPSPNHIERKPQDSADFTGAGFEVKARPIVIRQPGPAKSRAPRHTDS